MAISSRLTLRTSLALGTTAVALAALTACGSSSSDSAADAGNGSAPSAQASGSAGGSGQGGNMPGASGQIAAKDGTTLQVQNQSDGQVAVTYTGKTSISAQVAAALKNVKVGSCVTVTPADSSDSSSTQSTSITAATVRISDATDGECTGGFGGGGFGGGSRPSGAASGMPTTMPTNMPTNMPSGGAGGMRGGFGANGKVTAVSDSGFTVESSVPGNGSSSDTTSSSSITVTVSGSTTYTTTETSDASALKVGKCVVATGESDDTGAVAATRLIVSDPVDGSCSTGFGGGRSGQGGAPADAGQQGGAQ